MTMLRHIGAMTRLMAGNAGLLAAITRVELRKRYAGAVLGVTWLVLQPALLLSVYLFVYLVVFKIRFPGFSQMDFVLYVFAGLVPFLGANEAMNGAVLSIKSNMHLVKNVMMPIELVPVRTVIVALTVEAVALGLVLVLTAFNGGIGPMVLVLPVAIALQVLALLGIAWILAGLGVALPDLSYFVSVGLFLLMFVSPVAFTPEMVPPSFQVVVYGNPVYYMLEIFRDCLIAGRTPTLWIWATHAALSVTLFSLGAVFFRSFKSVLVDSE